MSQSNPTLLAFDTSAAHCAAALLCDGRIVAQRHEEMAKGQGERLMGLLQEVLDDHGAVWGDLDGIGVGIGPGNFTGIRISVSAARGLALGLGIPAIGVSNFEVLHHAAARTDTAHHLVILSQRAGYYVQPMVGPLRRGAPLTLAKIDSSVAPPVLEDPDHTVILGENAAGLAHLIEQAQGRPIVHQDCAMPWPDIASHIAKIAATRLNTPPERPAPLYVRAPDAAPPRDTAPVILP
ncbi:tRNA (adenosine(37)-N6)-threonylcarbamoyltransferase complex dimerization subunit type 1 TsaB [Oceaniglobus ichthyenteri]|uniref:tRNA (adenosine(37)-N6)-threonylcarbamoyltransferase complex dimerization subunit type 1 TsaB n=1 Tax=Oceaniglobus ichthyenteri TaxID=2136177 RepID=UPI000D3A01D5|nr:tRNA (adenosine(37)-N6)-threonylcarbamoyltransferase complex dimerization subunit type 1 TsaB [Oceaniglobus ichthyenteri]